MKDIIKNYLVEQSKTDTALQDAFKESMLDACIDYITKKAEDLLNGKSGMVEDATVYHWAREFYVDGIAEEKQTELISSKKISKKTIDALKQMEFNFD